MIQRQSARVITWYCMVLPVLECSWHARYTSKASTDWISLLDKFNIMFSLAALGRSSSVHICTFSFWILRRVSESNLIDLQTATLVSCCIFSVSFLESFNSASNKLILFWTSPKTWQCLGANLQNLGQKTCPKPPEFTASEGSCAWWSSSVFLALVFASASVKLVLSWMSFKAFGKRQMKSTEQQSYSRTADSCQKHPETNEKIWENACCHSSATLLESSNSVLNTFICFCTSVKTWTGVFSPDCEEVKHGHRPTKWFKTV